MGRTAILKVDILSDFNDRGFKKSNGALAKFGSLAKAGAAAAGVALVAGAAKGVSAASNLAESTNAVGVVFGKSSKTITQFGKTAADSVGLSQREFQELATGTGALLTNFGYKNREAADATVVLAQRAADMASVFNTDVGTALEAVNAGLRGETEPLRKFGVNLDDATLKMKAAELGLYDGTGALSANAKAQAAYAVILDQTKKVQGDFANTSGSLANVQRRIGAHFENIAAKVGQALLPAVEKVAQWFADVLIPALSDAATWFRENLGPAIDTVRNLFTGLGDQVGDTGGVFNEVVGWIREKWSELAPKFKEWFDKIGEIISKAAQLIQAVVERVTAIVTWIWENFGDEIMATAEFVWDTLVRIIDFALEHIKGLIDFFTALFKGDWQGMGDALKRITENFGRAVVDILRNMGQWMIDVFRSLKAKAEETIRAMWARMVDAVRRGVTNVLTWVRSLPGRVVSALASLASRGYQIGRDLIMGMVRGIVSFAGDLVDRVRSVISNAIDAAKRLLGIASPSKVFADIGMQVAAGMAAGLTAGATSLVAPAVAGLVDTSGTSATSLSGRRQTVLVNGTTSPQQTARELAGMIHGARVRTGYAGLAA